MSATAITVIEREKVAAINREHALVIQNYGSALEHAINCGRMLSAVKADLAHGEWLPWLEANTEIPERMAQRYMQVAGATELADPTRVSDLSLRAALEQVQTPRRRPMSTNDVAGLLGGMGRSPTRERQVTAPVAAGWVPAQDRKRERALGALDTVRDKLDEATGDELSAFAISDILRSAALECRRAASMLDELAFSFER